MIRPGEGINAINIGNILPEHIQCDVGAVNVGEALNEQFPVFVDKALE
jgi:hypothetical protein